MSAQGTSLQQFLTPLILNFIIFAALVGVFIALRKKFPRIYEPKTYVHTVPKRRRTDALPGGPFSWFTPLAMRPDLTLLEKVGLDGYLFLRYLKFMLIVCVGGCVLLWPVLFPVYATGPAGQSGIDVISMSNISGSTGRFYASVLMGWLWIAAVCFGIFREYQHYLLVRQEYLTSPQHSRTLQARTVLITQIPESHRSVEALQAAFGSYTGGIEHIYLNRDLKKLQEDVEERQKLSLKLEAAQTKLIKLASKTHFKAKSFKKHNEAQAIMHDTENSHGVASTYLPQKKRPSHKLGFLGLFGKKVDTIEYCTSELNRLNPLIQKSQGDLSSHKVMNSAFIQFHTQAAAQACTQAVAHGRAWTMAPRYTEIAPHDIVWSNMALTWQSRLIKSSLCTAFVVALIVFWTIPVAFVGVLSNITYLTEKVPFLRFINNCPQVILGLITAYLPTILLAVLMALLPIILRMAARLSGIPTLSGIEYAVCNSYFTFLVVQSFLVVTVVSSAVSAVSAIINNPSSATTILAAKLPAAANFYIAYILLQGLAISAGTLAQIAGLILFFVLGKLLDSTPRKKFNRFAKLSSVSFGTLFPLYTFLAVITLIYSLISPLILVFAAFTYFAFFIAFKYSLLYVFTVNVSTSGMIFPRALQQTMVGLYIMELCLLGLVSVGQSYGSIVLTIIAIIGTILFHLKLNSAFSPLLQAVPSIMCNSDPEPNETELADMGTFDSQKLGRTEGVLSPMSHGHDAYTHFALTSDVPGLWIPSDSLGVSRDEAERTRRDTRMTVLNSGAVVDEKGNMTWDQTTAPPDYDAATRDVEI